MNFNFYLLKSLRLLLSPFSLLYGSIIITRNFLYDKKIIRSVSFNLPVINVGNLSAGGTGKTPMVEYLITLLKDRYKVATLSRGYKRKTRGYVLANEQTIAFEIGDEPMQFYQKFPDVAVVAGEERILAIPHLLQDRPEINVIILDDAFQHRRIQAGYNILLTQYGNLFTADFFLPTGNLRDQRSAYKRADVIVVTKCPFNLSEKEKDRIIKDIHPFPHQKVFFTAMEYGKPYHIITKEQRVVTADDEVLLVCGIANPTALKNYLAHHSKGYYLKSYPDHHTFSNTDLIEIGKRFESMDAEKKLIITTEKDMVRLMRFAKELKYLPLFVLPVKHTFLFGEGMQFDYIVNTYVKTFGR